MRSLRLGLASVVLAALLGAGAWAAMPDNAPIPQPAPATAALIPAPEPRYRSVEHTIVEGDTAGAVLRALLTEGGAPTALSGTLIGAAGRGLDRLSIGDRVVLDFRDGEAEPFRLRLESDAPTRFELSRGASGWSSGQRPVPFRIETGARELVVSSSLWDAALTAGLRPTQIISVARIFEYDVDFNTELVKGAIIRLAADTLTAEDGSTRVGNIRGAVLQNGAKTYTAVRYVHRDGTVGWYAPDGTGRRRPFLRSPLEFSRVTSGFNKARFHPVLKVRRPHLGVDFGAPTGTPVRAVADGVVTSAGPHGGHGNYIELDHEGPYATSYSHLSAVLVKRGQKVRQGDLIGRVGSTGMSTGPHLHYQFFVNGKYVDPMTVDLPMTGSLPDAEREAFFAVRDAVMPLLAAQEAAVVVPDAGAPAEAPVAD